MKYGSIIIRPHIRFTEGLAGDSVEFLKPQGPILQHRQDMQQRTIDDFIKIIVIAKICLISVILNH